MGLISRWKKGNAPKQKYYGGDQLALGKLRDQAQQGIAQGADTAQQGLDTTNTAATRAGQQYDALNSEQHRLSQRSNAGFDRTVGALEADAANASQDYRRTADSAFQANQDRNMRQALALGNRGGAAGVRAAIDAQSSANAQAASEAEVTRANEQNQLLGLRQNALTTAAGMYSGRQQGADTMRAQNVGTAAGLAQNAGSLQAQTGLAQQGSYLDAQQNMENSQLNAARENEQLRIEGRRTRFNRISDPLGLHGGK
jgi:hypothetical protein